MNEVVKKYLENFTDYNVKDLFNTEEIKWLEYNLLCIEEKENTIKDIWGNWDFQFTTNNYQTPFVDEFIINKLESLNLSRKSIWPENKKFAIFISHDVDNVSSFNIKEYFKYFFIKIKSSPNKLNVLLHLFDLIKVPKYFFSRNDPIWKYEKWIDELEKYHFKSTFFFFSTPDKKDFNYYDCTYEYTDKILFDNKKISVSNMINEIHSKGFEIGLHGSYNSFSNSNLLIRLKNKLETVLSKKIICSRQHFLHFDINKTPKILLESDIKIDSTFGFNRAIGFRNGTSFPFFLSDNNNKILDVLEMPLHIMDCSLFYRNSLGLNEEFGIKKSIALMDKIEKVGGCLSINFHPNYLNNPVYFNTFKAIICEAKKRNVFCTSLEFLTKLINEK